MRPFKFALCLILLAANVSALAADEIDRAIVERIRTEATERSKVLATFGYITDVTGARLTGSRAHKQAAEYMRDRFTEWGLADAHLEPFSFGRGWELQKFSLELTSPRYFPLNGYPEAWTPSAKSVLTGTPIYIGDKSLEQIEAMSAELRGAIVLAAPPQTGFAKDDRPQPADTDQPVRIGSPLPPARPVAVSNSPSALAKVLQPHGVGAVLRPSGFQHGTVGVSGNPATVDDAAPTVIVQAEHYNMLVRLTRAGLAPKVRLELKTSYLTSEVNTYNVVAELPGVDPVLKNEIVMVGAHLDSWHASTGATDNADGVAAVAEAMRILKAVGAKPRRTIRVALWSGEEIGFLGGKSYVEKHFPDAQSRNNVSVYLNNDPGAGKSYGWFMANNDAARKIFDGWVDQLKDIGVKRNRMEHSFSSEDGIFDGIGIPAFTTIQDYTHYDVRTRHTNADFYEAVSEADLQQQAMVLAVFAYQAAMRDEKIPRRPAGVPPMPERPRQ